MRTTFRSALRRVDPAIPLGLVPLFGPVVGGLVVWATLPWWSEWLQGQGVAGMAGVAAAAAVGSGCGVLPVFALAVASGWAFGFGPGCAPVLLGAYAAAALGYAAGRAVAGRRIVDWIGRDTTARAVYEDLTTGSVAKRLSMIAVMRFASLPPFEFANVFFGAMRIAPGVYAVGTAVALAMRLPAAVYLGSVLPDLAQARSAAEPVWVTWATFGCVLALFVLIAHVARRAVRRRLTP